MVGNEAEKRGEYGSRKMEEMSEKRNKGDGSKEFKDGRKYAGEINGEEEERIPDEDGRRLSRVEDVRTSFLCGVFLSNEAVN